MATREMSSAVSEEVLDEVWLMMHMAAEMGCSHYDKSQVEENSKKFIFEAEVEPEFLHEVVETDNPEDEDQKEKALIKVAEKLMQLGDDLQTRKQQKSEIEQLSKEIADHIKQYLQPEIERRLGPQLSRATAINILTETGVLNNVYGFFKKKVEEFIGLGEDMNHIALVTSITRGVASGLQQSSSGVAGLLATVSTQFVAEKFGAVLQQKRSLTSIVAEETSLAP